MTWITTEYQVGCADTDGCQFPGCTSTAAVRFVSVNVALEGKPRRSTARCSVHAVEMRAQIAQASAASTPVPAHPKPAADPLPPATPAPMRPPAGPRRLFPIPPNAPSGICKACLKTIVWIQPKGKLMPVDPTGEPHWATCTDPDRFRSQR